MAFHNSHKLSSLFFILFSFSLLNFKLSVFKFPDPFFCLIRSPVDAVNCIFHFHSLHSLLLEFFQFLFYNFQFTVKLVLFMGCFPDFIVLSTIQTDFFCGVSYWKMIVFLWLCQASLIFHVSYNLSLMSSHLMEESPLSDFKDQFWRGKTFTCRWV